MVDFLKRDPYMAGRDAGLERRSGMADRAAIRDLTDIERAGAETKRMNDIALDRNVRSSFQGSPLRTVGSGQPAAPQPTGPQVQQPAVGPQPSSMQAPRPQRASQRLSGAILQTPGYGVQGAKMAVDDDAKDMEVFGQTMKYIAAGQPEMAKEHAARYGDAIPDNILGNAAVTREMTEAWNHYSKIYEGRPADLKKAMEVETQNIIGRNFKGGQGPANRFANPALPKPQETSRSERNYQPAAVQTAEWLVAQGVAKDPREAWQMMSTAKSSPYAKAQVVQRIFASMQQNFQDTRPAEEKWAEANELVDGLVSGMQTPPPASAGGGAAPPSNQPPVRKYVPGQGFK